MPEIATLAREGDIAVLTIDSPPVNALSHAVRSAIADRIAAAGADPAVKAIVLICAGRTFFAGADITEFGKPPRDPILTVVEEQIEAAPKPVVAAIHGTALGGGFEIALACHWRVAVPSARVGLPEVKLGMLPGAGGTQRLPRLTGVATALDMIVTGEPVGAQKARELGIIDEIAPEGGLRQAAIAFAGKVAAGEHPLRRIRDMDDRIAGARGDEAPFAAAQKAHGRRFRGTKQLEGILAAIRAAVELPFDEGMKREREIFMGLMMSREAAAQRHVFFAEREAAKIPDIGPEVKPRAVGKVGVIGAGTMGGGIAMNFLSAGIPVTIVETQGAALERGTGLMRRNYEASARRGRMSMADVETRMGLLGSSLDMAALADCDLVIEAVFENMALKKEVFAKLDAIAKPGAILASNTSYLDVNEIAAVTKRPQDVLGLHFFSPANVMRLLEVVRGERTATDVVATAMALARKIGKVPVQVGVCHGFVGNRMLAARQKEANALILEGALPWDVDRVLYDFGLPMGPFAMSDLAGLDIGWSRETSKGETIREILCERDRRGQKTGAGFYDYDENRKATPSKLVEELIIGLSARQGIARRVVGDEEILQRCIYPMINEGAKILEEGKALRASDIDTVWINGYGWPPYRGGPMFYADEIGLAKVRDVLKGFEAAHGARFRPAALLERLAGEGKGFRDL